MISSYQRDGEDYTISQYLLNSKHASQHRWFYFPKMRKDELVLFKMHDSDTTREGRSSTLLLLYFSVAWVVIITEIQI